MYALVYGEHGVIGEDDSTVVMTDTLDGAQYEMYRQVMQYMREWDMEKDDYTIDDNHATCGLDYADGPEWHIYEVSRPRHLTITTQLPDTINEGERLIRIFTNVRSDEFYVVCDEDDMDLEHELRQALYRKLGYGAKYRGYEDVTFIVERTMTANAEAEAVWQGEGRYEIWWSDGGRYGETRWYEMPEELAGDVMSALDESTETHLPYPLFCGEEE